MTLKSTIIILTQVFGKWPARVGWDKSLTLLALLSRTMLD